MSSKESANLIYEIQRELSSIDTRLDSLRSAINITEKQARLKILEEQMAAPNFWTDQAAAQALQQEKSQLVRAIDNFNKALDSHGYYVELIELSKNDELALLELEQNVQALNTQVRGIEMECMLCGEHDKNNAILSINVGQGGVDSQDFAQMLLRMYRRYAERKGFEITIMEYQPAEEAGIKNAAVLIAGDYAYGYLQAEIGVHRLVRISPFDSAARRHTSFASVWVIPEVDDSIEIAIKTEDLRIDTFRAGGAGGQHVNKTDSAVRITHLPTNTVVACQAERSQIKNRSTAMKILKARLYELEMRNRLKERNKAEASKLEASFGSQIRNYVMAPYRLVKDLRTSHEVGNVDAVLDGDIQGFIDAYLLKKNAKI